MSKKSTEKVLEAARRQGLAEARAAIAEQEVRILSQEAAAPPPAPPPPAPAAPPPPPALHEQTRADAVAKFDQSTLRGRIAAVATLHQRGLAVHGRPR